MKCAVPKCGARKLRQACNKNPGASSDTWRYLHLCTSWTRRRPCKRIPRAIRFLKSIPTHSFRKECVCANPEFGEGLEVLLIGSRHRIFLPTLHAKFVFSCQ